MLIKDLKDGVEVFGPYLVADSKKCVSSAGKPYLTVTLQDCSGTIDGKKWDYQPEDDKLFEKGSVVQIQGNVLLYASHLQLKIKTAEALDQKGIDWSIFVPSAPVDQDILQKKLDVYLNSFRDPVVGELVKAMLNRYMDHYLQWPAAVRNHHNFASGLLFHSLTMTDLALKVCEIYPSLNRDIMLAGTLIHDIGKVIELSGPNGTVYTLEGKLLGHISLGHAELREIAKNLGYFEFASLSSTEQEKERQANSDIFHRYEVAVTLEHIILSHHGKMEFGSPVLPVTREALAISMIDDMDAKMLILDAAYNGTAKGENTPKVMALDGRFFYRPFYSSDDARPYGTSVEEEEKDLAAGEPKQGQLF